MARLTSHHSMLPTLSKLLLPTLVVVTAFAACSKATGGSGGSGNGGSGGEGNTIAGSGGAGGTGGQGGSAGGIGGAGGGSTGCKTDADCQKDPNGTVCETSTGLCVGCLPLDPPDDDCGQGQYCNPLSKQCEVGCTSKFDCMMGTQACDETIHKCVGCAIDTDCPDGSVCVANTCIEGCSGIQNCQQGFTCCGASCYDLASDELNCGLCNTECAPPPNGNALCDNGVCTLGTCKANFADCDNDPSNGCEWNILQDGPCACVPGAKQPCYQGAPGTLGIGVCKAGVQTCKDDGSGWGDCIGQVLPKYEICANNLDEDCDGVADNNADADGDGWPSCGGDCCDAPGPGCTNPKYINPGAFEVVGNNQDDDCNPATPDATEAICSTQPNFGPVTADDVAKAMDLCQFTEAMPSSPLKKTWGVISTVQLLANGVAPTGPQLDNIQNKQSVVLSAYGTNVMPKKGPTMAGFSTGIMRDQDDVGYAGTSNDLGTTGSPPAAYLAANGNKLPAAKNCLGNACPVGTGGNDPVNVRLKIRVPTNAKSFSYSFKFYSSEYFSYQCSTYNDFFLALLNTTWKPDPADPTQKPLPADKNISFDENKNPISVNNGFFDVCTPKGDCNTCPAGVADLQGTGLQIQNQGGATKWLTTDAPVVPGEEIDLELMIFDVGDRNLNSYILLDNFRWNQTAAVNETHE